MANRKIPASGLKIQSPVYEKLRAKVEHSILIRACTQLDHLVVNDTFLHAMNGLRKRALYQTIRKALDFALAPLDRLLFRDTGGARLAFFGRKNANDHKSVFGGLGGFILGKYLDDWESRQKSRTTIPRVKRDITPPPKTYVGWKALRDELQPGWRPVPPDGPIQVLPGDQMDPRERLTRLIHGKDTDRVGFGPLWNYAIAFLRVKLLGVCV